MIELKKNIANLDVIYSQVWMRCEDETTLFSIIYEIVIPIIDAGISIQDPVF